MTAGGKAIIASTEAITLALIDTILVSSNTTSGRTAWLLINTLGNAIMTNKLHCLGASAGMPTSPTWWPFRNCSSSWLPLLLVVEICCSMLDPQLRELLFQSLRRDSFKLGRGWMWMVRVSMPPNHGDLKTTQLPMFGNQLIYSNLLTLSGTPRKITMCMQFFCHGLPTTKLCWHNQSLLPIRWWLCLAMEPSTGSRIQLVPSPSSCPMFPSASCPIPMLGHSGWMVSTKLHTVPYIKLSFLKCFYLSTKAFSWKNYCISWHTWTCWTR